MRDTHSVKRCNMTPQTGDDDLRRMGNNRAFH